MRTIEVLVVTTILAGTVGQEMTCVTDTGMFRVPVTQAAGVTCVTGQPYPERAYSISGTPGTTATCATDQERKELPMPEGVLYCK